MRSTAASSPRSVSLWLGVLFFVPGALWLLILSRWKESDAAAVAARSDGVGRRGTDRNAHGLSRSVRLQADVRLQAGRY